jgi:hypothetical protein
MEIDDEMADYGTDLSDDVESIVDPHFDAKAPCDVHNKESLSRSLRDVVTRCLDKLRVGCRLTVTVLAATGVWGQPSGQAAAR